MHKKQSIRLSPYKFKKLVARVIERDEYDCRICGRTTLDLTVHHIIPKGRIVLDIKDNLLTVCASCHSNIHKSLGGLSVDGVIKDYGKNITMYLYEQKM